MRKVFLLAILLACCATAFSTVTVNATLNDPQGQPLSFAFLKFDLDYCGFNVPQVPGSTFSMVSKSIKFTQAQLPATLYANNEITCGNKYSTLWKVTAYADDNTPILGTYDYNLCSSTTNCASGVATVAWNLASAQPFTLGGLSPGLPAPGFQTIFGNPTQSQVITQPVTSSLAIVGTLDLTNANVIGLVCNFAGCGGGGGGGGTPASPVGAVQFNGGGIFSGDANFTWDNVAKKLTVGIPGPNNGLISVLNSGIFTTVQMNEYVTSKINGCSTTSLFTANPFFSPTNLPTTGIADCITIPSSATNQSIGLLSEIDNQQVGGAGYGVVGTVRNNGNDNAAVGVYGIAWDAVNAGWTNIEQMGVICGASANNSGGGAATYQILDGCRSIAVFTVQPATVWSGDGTSLIGNAFRATSSGANHWNIGYYSDPGGAAVGSQFDGQCTLGLGHNCNSQFAQFTGVNAGVRGPAAGLGADKTGDLLLTTGSGAVVVTNNVRSFATLPACSSTIEGGIAPVNNSNTAVWGATIAAGGGNHVLAYCDGTNWTVAAK